MKRKILTILLALVAALCLAFGLSACAGGDDPGQGGDGDAHVHTYSEEWSYDAAYHWHAATCGHDEKSDLGTHNIEDGICTVCGAVFESKEGLEFSLSDDGTYYSVTDYTGTATEAYIPSTHNGLPVTSIGDYAFEYCSSLTSVTIPDSMTSIGSYAFYGCTNLTSVTIPDGVTSIGSYAFEGCTNLTSIIIPDSVTSIGYAAFYNCNSLESITLPFVGAQKGGTENTHFGFIFGVSSYSYNGGYVPASLKEVIITGGDSIADYAFYGCSSLTSIVIPDSVTSIWNNAFSYCESLTSVTIGSGVTSIGSYAFYNCDSLTSIVIPDSVTSIWNNAFSSCRGLTSVTIGSGVTSIGNEAFAGCDNIIQVENGVSYVDKWAIDCDASATSVELRADTVGIADCAFRYCSSLTSVTIPDSVTSIGSHAFSYCESLTSITIPDGVTSIGSHAFSYCESLKSITVASGNPVYHSAGNCLIETDSKTLIAGCKNSIIPTDGSVTSIGNYAFSGCSSLTSITIPDSVTSIGERAFYWCSSLTSIIIPDSVTSIGDYAFYNCDSLTSIIIPDSVTSIGYAAFYNCHSLTSIIIPDSVTSIGDYAFSGCYSLETVYYAGSEEDWQKIDIGSSNSGLEVAEIIFNYEG